MQFTLLSLQINNALDIERKAVYLHRSCTIKLLLISILNANKYRHCLLANWSIMQTPRLCFDKRTAISVSYCGNVTTLMCTTPFFHWSLLANSRIVFRCYPLSFRRLLPNTVYKITLSRDFIHFIRCILRMYHVHSITLVNFGR